MPVFLLSIIARTGIPQRFAKVAAWIMLALIAAGLVWACVSVFREWVATGKEDAVALDRADISAEATNRVVEAMTVADANQQAKDDEFANQQQELRHEADTKADNSSVGPGVVSVLDRMRQQQAAGRRN